MALIGATNAEKIWNYCISRGLTKCGTAGLMGNLEAESSLNPKNLQDSYQSKIGCTDETYVLLVDSGSYTKDQFINDQAGFGLCQWTYWTRKRSLYEHAKYRNCSIGDLEMQLEFLFTELQNSFQSVLNVLKSATSVEEASDIFLLKFECPYNAESKRSQRASFGYKYYTLFVTNSTTKTEGVIKMGYKQFAKGQAVKVSDHFYSTEFDCHGSGCCSETIINEELIERVEQIRCHFNSPITITSPYRCPTHNSRIGGATGSRHSNGDAADIVVKGQSPRTVAQYAESIGILGIGLYETGSDGYFVHIDTRDYRSFWYGQSEQPRTTFGAYSGSVSTGNNVQNTNVLDTILNMGDFGSAVKSMQEKLIRLGYSCGDSGADGDFGNATYNAVVKFQRAFNLGDDGIAGNQTLTALDNAIETLDNNKQSESVIGSKIKTTASLLNVRSGPGTKNRIVKQVKFGTIATVVDEEDDWYKLDNPDGWVSSEYVEQI